MTFAQKFKQKESQRKAEKKSAKESGLSEPDFYHGQSADDEEISNFLKGKPSENLIDAPPEDFSPDPSQPRKTFNPESLNLLQQSIEMDGQLQPIVVREDVNGKWIIIAGERRWRAISKSKKVKKVKAFVVSRESEEFAILRMQIQENSNREDVLVLEEAAAIVRGVELSKKVDPGVKMETAAKNLGVSNSKVSKSRAIISADESIRALCYDGFVNDYSSLYELSRAFKKYPSETKSLIASIREGLVINIRSAVKNFVRESASDVEVGRSVVEADDVIETHNKGGTQESQEAQSHTKERNQKTNLNKSHGEKKTEKGPPEADEEYDTSMEVAKEIEFLTIKDEMIMEVTVNSKKTYFSLSKNAIKSVSDFR